MGSLKNTLFEHGMKWVTESGVLPWMQDERVVKLVVAAMSVPAKAQSFAKEQLDSVARAMSLATEDEINDLRRTVRKLEDELAELRADGVRSASKASP